MWSPNVGKSPICIFINRWDKLICNANSCLTDIMVSWKKNETTVFYILKFWSSGKITDCYAKPFKVSNPHYFMLLTTSVMEIPVLVHCNSSVCDIRWLQPDYLVDIIPSAPLRMPGCWLKRATGQNFCLKCQRQESARDQSVPRVTCAHKNSL